MISARSYSRLERILHHTAFSSKHLQLAAADVEKAIFGRHVRPITASSPVFISSLPRAGTTLLLEVLIRSGHFASHCYRDMPFVMAPLLWNRLSSRFRETAERHERAHGDGMLVGFDSPEAFEEVLWRAFWPKKFEGERISLWTESDRHGEFDDFFQDHMRRVIAVRAQDTSTVERYVSKNNANIARVAYLKRRFPESLLIVPFREPLEQSASLLRQHVRFTTMHREDPFSKAYMRDIGHLEFGELHQPIDFGGMHDVVRRFPPTTINYWLSYWCAAFTALLREHASVVFLSYDRFCRHAASSLRALGDLLDLRPTDLHEARKILREPTWRPHAERPHEDLLGDADGIHAALLDLSVV